ncbi:MAG TPA: hypothetical protein VI299_13605, partial [Polyangiales bacterium]
AWPNPSAPAVPPASQIESKKAPPLQKASRAKVKSLDDEVLLRLNRSQELRQQQSDRKQDPFAY